MMKNETNIAVMKPGRYPGCDAKNFNLFPIEGSLCIFLKLTSTISKEYLPAKPP